MKILWLATKLPWPPVDGGRLLMLRSFQALAEAGHPPTVVAPDGGDPAAGREATRALAPWARLEAVPAAPRSRSLTLLASLLGGKPWTLGRHALPAVARRVETLLAAERYDVVQVEQLQALGSLPTSVTPPVVWRAQNVESDLWRATARHRPPPLGWWLSHQARGLARREGRAVARARAVLTLTEPDARRLAELARRQGATETRLIHLPTPFPDQLPAADTPLPGEPAVVVLGSSGWWPNRQGTEWFLHQVVPALLRRLPGVRVHCFGDLAGVEVRGGGAHGAVAGGSESVVRHHPAPEDSRQAFAPGAFLAVPLFVASGVRMKILEAWARGVPVVATTAAARGLEASDGRELLIADQADDFAQALARLAHDPELARSLVTAGRELLRRRHALPLFARELLGVYRQLSS